MRLPAGLRALGHRNFRLFWTGQAVSVVGSWMQTVGQAWLVLELTGSAFRLGLVTALQFAPVFVLSIVAGVLVDRVDKRRLIVGTQCALMGLALSLAALTWTGHVRYWHVAVLACAIGVVNAFDMPARQSFVSELVGPDDLVNAIALGSASFNAARVVGPALGGVVIGRFGLPVAFLANGASFLAVIIALLVVRGSARAPGAPSATLRAEMVAGLRYALTTPIVRFVLSLVVVVSVAVLNHTVLVPLYARDVLREGVHGFGLLMAALGAGALTGAVGLAGLGRGRPRLATVVAPPAVAAAGLLSLAFVRVFWLAAPLVFLIGGAQIVFLAGCNTTLQLTTPSQLRGRVMSLYVLAFAGLSPLGSFLMGSLAEAFGVQVACAAGGSLGLVGVLVLVLRARRRPW